VCRNLLNVDFFTDEFVAGYKRLEEIGPAEIYAHESCLVLHTRQIKRGALLLFLYLSNASGR